MCKTSAFVSLVIGLGRVSSDMNSTWDLGRLCSLFYFPFCLFEVCSALFWAHFCSLLLSLFSLSLFLNPVYLLFITKMRTVMPDHSFVCVVTVAIISTTDWTPKMCEVLCIFYSYSLTHLTNLTIVIFVLPRELKMLHC